MGEAGLSAAELAQRTGLTEGAISYLRSGRRQPSFSRCRPCRRHCRNWPPAWIAKRSTMDSIESAIADIRAGKMVIVLDDEDRENEGDLVMAAEWSPPRRSTSCARRPADLSASRSRANDSTNSRFRRWSRQHHAVGHRVQVSVEARGRVTTGISAHDAPTRSRADRSRRRPRDFLRPGHTFPLRARDGGVLVRAVKPKRRSSRALAGLEPAGVICEIMDEDGSMMRLPHLREFATQARLKLVTVKDLIAYRMRKKARPPHRGVRSADRVR